MQGQRSRRRVSPRGNGHGARPESRIARRMHVNRLCLCMLQ